MKVVLNKKEDKKKVWLLALLGVIAAYTLYTQVFSSDTAETPAARSGSVAPPVLPGDAATPASGPRRGITSRRNGTAFVPVLRSPRPEDRPDPAKIDPTLRLDLLAKVQGVALEGGSRNLFQFGAAPPPASAAGPIPKEKKIAVNNLPPVVAAPPSGPPAPPPPPLIPLKYYGYTNAKGDPRKKAFFLDGEDIIVAREGETIKSRYKVVHVGVNSVEVEDTQFKNKQTLPLAEEATG